MGVFLAAAGVLALEVLLTRVFSVVMWYHFASMAIAITMFGISVGGLLPYLFRRRGTGPEGSSREEAFGSLPSVTCMWLSATSLLFTAAPYAVLLAFARYPLWGGKLLSVFHQPYFEPFRTAGGQAPPAGDALQIGLLLLLFSLPFVGAGAIFAMAFSRRGKEGGTYLAVMGGSAVGVVAYLVAMQGGSGPAAFLFLSALFSLSAAAFARTASREGSRRIGGSPIPTVVLLAVTVLLLAGGLLEVRYGFAEIRFVRGRYEPNLLWARWDGSSRVAVYPVSAEESSKAWGVSPAYTGRAPEQIGMVVDDTGYTALFGTGKNAEALDSFRYNVASAAYWIRKRGKALVIGPGGGKDILCALASGDFDVTAVEVNPLVVRAADREFAEFTGRPYRMPRVRAVVAEGRNFLASDRNRYDVLQMTQVFGRVPPSAGAFTMTENHLYTVEAFRDYLSHLTEDGILTITRFVYERRVWRILAMAREALRSLGEREAGRHILAFRDRGLVNILIRRAPWPDEEIAAAKRFSEEMRFPLMLVPGVTPPGLPGEVLSGTYGKRFETFDFSAPTDDRPFFFYTLSPRVFLAGLSDASAEFDDRAVSMLRGFLASAAVLCAVFLIFPGALLARGDSAGPRFPASVYMFLVGVAFIVWEIVMIKKLMLLFGAPVLSLAAGLTMILAFAGAGGYLAGRKRAASPGVGFMLAVCVVTAYLFLAGETLSRWAGEPLAVRLAVSAAYVLPPSMLMGRFFPMGLMAFGGQGGVSVPFYFAANGAASVLGAALTQALALNLGYRVTAACGAVIYLCSAVLLLLARRERT
jgi:hypothetical protein